MPVSLRSIRGASAHYSIFSHPAMQAGQSASHCVARPRFALPAPQNRKDNPNPIMSAIARWVYSLRWLAAKGKHPLDKERCKAKTRV